MRCPKCGYISFDHLEKCLKCKKNIKANSDNLQGSIFNIAAPAFLALQTDQEGESSERLDLFGDKLGSDEEYVDEDLEILTEDADPEIVDEIELAENEDVEGEEDGEIEIDLSLFEKAADPEAALFDETEAEDELLAGPPITIEVPEELTDISDLAPPDRDEDAEGGVSEGTADSDFPDLELDDLNFDLGLDDLDDDLLTGLGKEAETVLVLDDIDFSDSLGRSGSKTTDKQKNMQMDEDLNFDLDLGGLSINKDDL